MGSKVKHILQGTMVLALVLALQLRASPAEAGTPVAAPGGPYSGDEGEIITFTGGAVDAEDPVSSMTFEWDFDFSGTFSANASGVNLISPTHTYTDDGTFAVALRVIDTNSNVSPIVSATVNIGNVPPSAGIGGPFSVDEGSALSFSGSATDPGNDTLTYEWDFDYDGQTFTVDASGEDLTSPSNTYNNDGSKTVALRVRDDDGGVSTIRTAAVTISNVPPTANAGSSYSVNEGSQLTFSGSAIDPGSDTLTYEWDFTYSGGQFNADVSGDALTDPKNTYNDDGSFTVALRVRDDDSTSQVATASVSVSNVLPTANAGGPYTGSVGSTITFAGSATDPGNDALTYEWDFEYDGQSFKTTGSTTQSGVNLTAPTYTYASEGSFTVALRVQDDDGASGIVTSTVTVSAGGATPTPVPTSTPTSSGGGGGGGGGVKKVATSTPKPTNTPTPIPATATPAPDPTLVSDTETTASTGSSEPVVATVDTTIVVSSAEVSTFEANLEAVIGEAVQVASTVLGIVSAADGSIVTGPELIGVSETLNIVGELNVTLGNLTLVTTDGVGTAVIVLSDGLKIEGAAVVDITNQGLDVVINKPMLVFEPAAPDVATLTGGSDKVTNIGVNFEVGLKKIRDNTSISVRFSKDANTVIDDADAKLISAAKSVGSVLEDPVRDVAFAVDVNKTGITNDDLGDNTVTMEVNRQWFDEKIAEGKSIAIAKFNESGAKFTTLATCVLGADSAKCSASFTGFAGGFSVFVLMGVRRDEATATPTATAFVAAPTATATALPTATATVKPTSTSVPPTATATQFSSVTIAVVEPTSTATRVPSTSTPYPTATAVTFAIAAPGPGTEQSSADSPSTTTTVDSGGGFPIAAFIGILIGVLALFGGGFAYAWKAGMLAENKWARKVVDLIMRSK